MLRDTGRRVLAIALMAAAAVFAHAAFAQVRIQNGVVIRPDLKGALIAPPPGSGLVIESANPSAEMLCRTNNVCQTALLVSPGGLKDDATTWEHDGCSVYWPYSRIKVGSDLQPALRWVLVKDPADPARYVFDATYGIRLKGNDPRVDLFKFTVEQNGTVFTWYNLHFRPWTIQFVPDVWRVGKDGKPSKKCNAGDPDVVNEN